MKNGLPSVSSWIGSTNSADGGDDNAKMPAISSPTSRQ